MPRIIGEGISSKEACVPLFVPSPESGGCVSVQKYISHAVLEMIGICKGPFMLTVGGRHLRLSSISTHYKECNLTFHTHENGNFHICNNTSVRKSETATQTLPLFQRHINCGNCPCCICGKKNQLFISKLRRFFILFVVVLSWWGASVGVVLFVIFIYRNVALKFTQSVTIRDKINR